MGPASYVLRLPKACRIRREGGLTELLNEIGEEVMPAKFSITFDCFLLRRSADLVADYLPHRGLALTKLDILDGFDTIEVCVGYKLDGKEIDYLPAGEGWGPDREPIYETIEGWKSSAGLFAANLRNASAINAMLVELVAYPVRCARPTRRYYSGAKPFEANRRRPVASSKSTTTLIRAPALLPFVCCCPDWTPVLPVSSGARSMARPHVLKLPGCAVSSRLLS